MEEEQQLLEALESQKVEVQALNEKSIEYNVLERDVESNRHIYNTLLQRMKMKASEYRAVRHGDGEGEAADAWILFQHRGIEGGWRSRDSRRMPLILVVDGGDGAAGF